ncbi:MAG: RNA polymerase factor sigma-54 [Armatimonadota bacterium]
MLAQRQQQTLEVRVDLKIVQAARLLQSNTPELEDIIEQEMVENPALERIESADDSTDVRQFSTGLRGVERIYDGDYDLSDGENDPVGNAVDQSLTLRESLMRDLRTLLPEHQHALVEYIIDNLDEHGLLLGFDVDRASLETGASPEEIEEVVRALQSLEPPGIGARSFQECMLLQLRDLQEQGEGNPLAERIVERYFDRLVHPPVRRIASDLKVSVDEVVEAVEYIKSALHPYPAYRFRTPWQSAVSAPQSTVKPDIIIRRNPAGFEVEIVRPRWFLIISPQWREQYEKVKKNPSLYPPETVQQVEEYIQRAEQLLHNLDARHRTLNRIARAVVNRQFAFLETGSYTYLQPLTRTEIGKELKLHESVVSRAISNKWVLLPNGDLIRFSDFFTSSLSIQQAIQEVIRSEDPREPYGDSQIAQILYERWGIKATRRTVVKHRNRLHIPSSRERKRKE